MESKAEQWYYETHSDFISDEKIHNDRNIWKCNYSIRESLQHQTLSDKQKKTERVLRKIFGNRKLFHGIEDDERRLYLHYLMAYVSPNTISFEPSSFLKCIETNENYFFTLVLFCKEMKYDHNKKNNLIKYLCICDKPKKEYHTKIEKKWQYPIKI